MNLDIAVDIAINNVIKDGLDDIFPKYFEIDLLKNPDAKKKIIDQTIAKLKKNNLDEMEFSPICYSYFPKKEAFDFRKSAQIQPWDLVKYLALAIQIAEDVELKRIKKEEKVVYSYRFMPHNGFLFDQNYDYKAFQKAITERIEAKKYRLIIRTDIANFYDRLNLHRLENALLSCTENKKVVKTLNHLLLFWSNRDSYGLPVGSNASRILAEAELIEIDNFLISKKIDFVRFVDDYRIFAHNAKEAHYYLNLFIARLSLEGLAVNTSKTAIERTKDFKIDKSIQGIDKKNRNVTEKQPTRLIAGYSGLIPTKFRNPTQKEIASLKLKEFDSMKIKLEDQEIVFPGDIRDYAKYIVINKKWDEYKILLMTVDNFPQFTSYIVDLFIKIAKELSDEARNDIRVHFTDLIQGSENLPEYIYKACVELLCDKNYENKFAVLNFYRDIKRSIGPFIGRYTLEMLIPKMTRGEIIEVKNEFFQVGNWEKRMIIKAVLDGLDEEEARPWIKNIKQSLKIDPFAELILEYYKGKKSALTNSKPDPAVI